MGSFGGFLGLLVIFSLFFCTTYASHETLPDNHPDRHFAWDWWGFCHVGLDPAFGSGFEDWIPAYAGMTGRRNDRPLDCNGMSCDGAKREEPTCMYSHDLKIARPAPYVYD